MLIELRIDRTVLRRLVLDTDIQLWNFASSNSYLKQRHHRQLFDRLKAQRKAYLVKCVQQL